MSYYVDTKYINFISSRMQRFAWKKNDLAVCRCPICGDSQKNKLKTRFYFYQKAGHFFVRCHNCAYSTTFSKFLEHMDAELYGQYRIETFSNTKPREVVVFEPQKTVFSGEGVDPLRGIPSIEELPDDHYAKAYVLQRKIPKMHHCRLYYAETFSVVGDRIDDSHVNPEDSRLVIPFYDAGGKLFAVQGRSFLRDSSLRYITVRRKDCDLPKIYGMERLNDRAKNYCVEGPIDSLFLGNCIAMAGFSASLNELPFDSTNTVFVLDNEPRNKEILTQMNRLIEGGRSVCIWPEDVTEKDINDMVLAGKDPKEIIDSNTYSGLMAALKFSKWRKL